MKVTELMIGDIAYVVKEYEDCNEEMVVEKFPARITAIDENGLLGMDGKNEFMCVVLGDCGGFEEFDDIEPIPLTAEILKKNGFKNERFRNEYYIYGTNFYVVAFDNTYSFQSSDMDLKYVHELQHALRLCGLNELANNFKI